MLREIRVLQFACPGGIDIFRDRQFGAVLLRTALISVRARFSTHHGSHADHEQVDPHRGAPSYDPGAYRGAAGVVAGRCHARHDVERPRCRLRGYRIVSKSGSTVKYMSTNTGNRFSGEAKKQHHIAEFRGRAGSGMPSCASSRHAGRAGVRPNTRLETSCPQSSCFKG